MQHIVDAYDTLRMQHRMRESEILAQALMGMVAVDVEETRPAAGKLAAKVRDAY